MASYLKNRQRAIPNGFCFNDAATGFRSYGQWPSFDTLVQQVVAARMGNPGIVAQHKLSTDPALVADEVDHFNAEVCRAKGWNDFFMERKREAMSASPPIQAPLNVAGRLAAVASGAKTLVQWVVSGAEAVPQEQAQARAQVCAACDRNTFNQPESKGTSWTDWFTIPVSHEITAQLQKRKDMKLATSVDDQLKVCSSCLCPIPLKVHLKLEAFLPRMSKQVFELLAPQCWIRSEAPKQ